MAAVTPRPPTGIVRSLVGGGLADLTGKPILLMMALGIIRVDKLCCVQILLH